jgi:zinc transporter 1/2/3
MTTLLTYKIIAAICIFLISLLSVIYPLKKKYMNGHLGERMQLSEALASGVFLGAAFFHMLPESVKQFAPYTQSIHYPLPELIAVLGFLVPLFLERLTFTAETPHSKYSIATILFFVLSIHAFTEGAAVGVGNVLSETLLIAVAIIAHKASESFALCVTLIRQSFSFVTTISLLVLFACITPLGIFAGNMALHISTVQGHPLLPASINAFAAGTFLYISTLHHTHTHEHKGDSRGLLEFFMLLLGVAVMAAIAIWA